VTIYAVLHGIYSSSNSVGPMPVVHNLFRTRATNRSLKPFGGQTGVTT